MGEDPRRALNDAIMNAAFVVARQDIVARSQAAARNDPKALAELEKLQAPVPVLGRISSTMHQQLLQLVKQAAELGMRLELGGETAESLTKRYPPEEAMALSLKALPTELEFTQIVSHRKFFALECYCAFMPAQMTEGEFERAKETMEATRQRLNVQVQQSQDQLVTLHTQASAVLQQARPHTGQQLHQQQQLQQLQGHPHSLLQPHQLQPQQLEQHRHLQQQQQHLQQRQFQTLQQGLQVQQHSHPLVAGSAPGTQYPATSASQGSGPGLPSQQFGGSQLGSTLNIPTTHGPAR